MLVVQLLFLNIEGACVSVRRLGWPATHLYRNLYDATVVLPNTEFLGLVTPAA